MNFSVFKNKKHQLSAHMPPCMRHLHAQLRRDQHLKHQGRMQYGLFLKGIGLSLEEALIFWRKVCNLKKKSTEQKCVKLLFVYYFFTGIWQIE
jgi:DNA primase large subunit